MIFTKYRRLGVVIPPSFLYIIREMYAGSINKTLEDKE